MCACIWRHLPTCAFRWAELHVELPLLHRRNWQDSLRQFDDRSNVGWARQLALLADPIDPSPALYLDGCHDQSQLLAQRPDIAPLAVCANH